MNENVIVKEYEFDKPLIRKIDFIVDICFRDCHNEFFHTFDHICVYDINFTDFYNIETVNLTFSDKNMELYELIKKLTVARKNGFIFNQISKLTTKIYSNLSNISIHYYLKLRVPKMHRHFFKKLQQNPEFIQTLCDDRRNPFHFAS